MMKKSILILWSVFCFVSLFAQERMYIHKSDKNTLGALISKVDSVKFSSDGKAMFLNMGTTIASYMVDDIDSLSFGENSNIISIQYNGNTATVFNPLAFEGVSINVNGADVTVTSTMDLKDIQYKLSGTTSDGSFKIYSERSFILALNGVNITNTNGPAINIQSKKAANILLTDGTTNILTDGTTYAPATITGGIAEDQAAAFFSESQLIFSGTGNLTIHGKGSDQRALSSDDYIQVDNGNITIASAIKDGIRTNDGFIMNGGSVNVTSGSDGIDGNTGYINIAGGTVTINCSAIDAAGMTCDSIMNVTGGSINITNTGLQSKGIKSTQAMTLGGGNITIASSGGVALTASGSGFDPSYCAAIKSDAGITVSGATITINHTGIAGKGISAGAGFNMTSGSVNITTSGNGGLYKNTLGTTDAYSATCISTNGTLSILGGAVTASSTGVGGKGFSADGILTLGATNSAPVVNVSTSGAAVMDGTNSVTESKVIKSDASINLINGTISLNSTGSGECIDTKVSINMTGGTVVAQGTSTTNVKTIDYVSGFNISGGTFMASGPYRTKSIPTPSTNSTQSYIYATLSTTNTTLAASTLFNIQDASKVNLVTYSPNRGAYYFIFSSPGVTKNKAFNLYTGGTTTGNNTNGLFTDGVYTPGTKKATFTTVQDIARTTVTFAK